MKELLVALLTWIAAEMGTDCPEPPRVVFVSAEEIAERAYGPRRPEGARATALYDREQGIIYLNRDWNAATLRDRSTLLHELVHHVQQRTQVTAPCLAAYERQAYHLQIEWLRQQGVSDPYALLEIDEFTISVRSLCPGTE